MPTTLRTRVLLLLAVWIAWVIGAERAWADASELAAGTPAGTLAYWSMDPAPFRREAGEAGGERMLLLGTLRAAVASGITGTPQQARWVEGLLAAAMVGEVPHTLAVLEFRAHRDAGAPKSEIDDLKVVLELRTRDRHAEYLRTLRAILIDAAHAKGLRDDAVGVQRRLDLPNGVKGAAYRAKGWPAWREVSWCSQGDRFIIAMGEGALERWLATEKKDARSAVWAALRAAGDPRGTRAVEAYLDLDALRARFPEGFDEGRVKRMVEALDLGDTSALLVRASLVPSAVSPPMLAIDWIARRGEATDIRALTRREWPEGLSLPVGGATYVAAAGVDWRAVFDRAMEIHLATFKAGSAERLRGKHAVWLQEHGAALDGLLAGLSPWLVLTDTPEPILPVPGLGSVFIAARPGVDASTLDSRLASLLTRYAGQVTRTADGMWSLRVDDGGLVRIPAWAFIDGKAHAMLAGGWGPPVVAHARKVMSQE